MKLQRTGYTEGDLIFCNYLKNTFNLYNDKVLNNIEYTFINWLYTTSGWYDKSIKGKYFDMDVVSILNSKVYKEFINLYMQSVTNSDHLILLFHENYFEKYISYLPLFKHKVKYKTIKLFDEYPWNSHKIYPLISNAKILVISSFDELIYEQYNNGNIYKIYNTFPVIKKLHTINFPYCFLNSGPDQNILETIEKIIEKIKSIDFDIALVGCGSSAAIIVDQITKMGKTGISMGSDIASMFGIVPGKEEKKYWITNIPKKYIPKIYRKIENGRYWIG